MLGLDPATHQRQLSKRMGVMLQEGGIYPSARVLETVRHYCRAVRQRRRRGRPGRARSGSTARSTGHVAPPVAAASSSALSLALALAAKPDVAFLDEPTSGVDINGRDAIRGIVRDLAADGCAVVLATHELDEAERLADRMVIIDDGALIADGTLAELRKGHDEIRFRSDPGSTSRALARRPASSPARSAATSTSSTRHRNRG